MSDRWLESVGVSVNLRCGNCNGPIHLPGYLSRVVCPQCAHHQPFDWDGFDDLTSSVMVAKPDWSRTQRFLTARYQGSIEARRADRQN